MTNEQPQPDNSRLYPVTLDRIAALFEQANLAYQQTEDQIRTGFGEVPMMIQIQAEGTFVLFRATWMSNLSEQEVGIANSHIMERHRSTYFPTFYTVRDDSGHQVVGDVCLFVGAPMAPGEDPIGVTDRQLQSYMGVFEMLEREINELHEAITEDLA